MEPVPSKPSVGPWEFMTWSSKSVCVVRDCLNPTVLTLAMLSATTACLVMAVTMPVSAV